MGIFLLLAIFIPIVFYIFSKIERLEVHPALQPCHRWKEKWPAITEDEFVEKCGPGTNRDKALRVRRIIAEQLGIEYDHIHPEQNFVKDLGCD